MDEKTCSVRLSESLLERIDRIAKRTKNEETVGKRVTRSSVIRECLEKGIERVEQELGLAQPIQATANGISGYAAVWKGLGEAQNGWVVSDSKASLSTMISKLEIPEPQLVHQVTVVPKVPELALLMDEEPLRTE